MKSANSPRRRIGMPSGNAQAATPPQIGVAYEPKALPEKVPLLVGQVTNAVNPRSGLRMTVVVKDKFTAVPMEDYELFAATRTVPQGRAYLFPRRTACAWSRTSFWPTASRWRN